MGRERESKVSCPCEKRRVLRVRQILGFIGTKSQEPEERRPLTRLTASSNGWANSLGQPQWTLFYANGGSIDTKTQRLT